jgi:large subunit ribosomal protein L5
MTEPTMDAEMTPPEPTAPAEEQPVPETSMAEATAPETDAMAAEAMPPEAEAMEPSAMAMTPEVEAAPAKARPARAIADAAERPAKAPRPPKAAPAGAAALVAEDPPAPSPAPAAPEAPAASGPRGLHAKYRNEVVAALVRQFEYANPNQVPKLDKIIVNVGLGEALSNAKAIDAASGDITQITGQKPVVTRARRSIAQFRVRTGNPIGLKVTLRGQRMWDFLERLTLLTLPRIRDFRGVPSRSFDGRGNYSLGMREQIAFPEIDYDKVDRLRGLEISIVTTAKSDEESKRLLELLGMPFAS